MKLTHKFAEMTPEKRPQDPHLDGTGLRFETMEHGGKYPDTMPQAIKTNRCSRPLLHLRTVRQPIAKGLCSIQKMSDHAPLIAEAVSATILRVTDRGGFAERPSKV